MLHRVHEILLVASPYDAFILEEDGRLTEQILYEYLGMNLSYAPRVWHADSAAKALKMLSKKKYNLVIVMMRISDMDPITFGAKVKVLYPKKPVILLIFDQSEIKQLSQDRLKNSIDKIFVWSGNANVFPAIIKYIEDRRNLKRDYKIADIRLILIVEDNPRYYSVILPLVYRISLKHSRNLISKGLSDTERLLTFRARPKIVLTSTYEEALKYYKKYRHNILGIISDVRFPHGDKLDPNAGVELTKYIRELDPDMPIMLQSTNIDQKIEAKKLKADFLHKRSSTLLGDLENFIVDNLGFGDFIFKNKKGTVIYQATDLNSFRKALNKIPVEILEYHATKNHFSNWLAARGEFSIASKMRPVKVTQFENLEKLRRVLINLLDTGMESKQIGKIVQYSSDSLDTGINFTRISTGSLGGKARGLAFANIILAQAELDKKYPQINIRIPRITVIGTDEFDRFMDDNHLWELALKEKNNARIDKYFLKADLSKQLIRTLSKFLGKVKYPLAVRSSSLLEDSQYQPLAGMYATYMLSNSEKLKQDRLSKLCQAIKLIYSSTFYREPKSISESSHYRHEEEKMAIIIMEMIGKKHENRFYPSVSGTMQSYNYYPVSYMEREEGVAHLALGLGRTIAAGERALRISPKYPGILPQYYSIESTIDNSQNNFYALNLNSTIKLKSGESKNLVSLPLEVAEKDGELYWAASVISTEDDVLRDSLRYEGTRVITFPSLLKWNMIPLPELLTELLILGEQSLGCPVEMEFALNMYREKDRNPDFCLLQIRPMVIGSMDRVDESEQIAETDLFCLSQNVLGNGIINDVRNIVIVPPHLFDSAHTQEIALEIEKFNEKMSDNSYILIGPGRWGSADPWLGIPVIWNQISKVKIIIEMGMKEFPIDPSFGSHFFQNVTSMRIGYFTIDPKKPDDILDWEWLKNQELVEQAKYTQWYRLEQPLPVLINGKTGKGKIYKTKPLVKDSMDEQKSPGI